MRAFIAVLLAWLGFAGSALAEKRLALVIGNDSYQHIDRLQKARADAKSYADLLREKGFSSRIATTWVSMTWRPRSANSSRGSNRATPRSWSIQVMAGATARTITSSASTRPTARARNV